MESVLDFVDSLQDVFLGILDIHLAERIAKVNSRGSGSY